MVGEYLLASSELDILGYLRLAIIFCGFPKIGAPQIIQVMDDHDLVLKPMVTWGTPMTYIFQSLLRPQVRIHVMSLNHPFDLAVRFRTGVTPVTRIRQWNSLMPKRTYFKKALQKWCLPHSPIPIPWGFNGWLDQGWPSGNSSARWVRQAPLTIEDEVRRIFSCNLEEDREPIDSPTAIFV